MVMNNSSYHYVHFLFHVVTLAVYIFSGCKFIMPTIYVSSFNNIAISGKYSNVSVMKYTSSSEN